MTDIVDLPVTHWDMPCAAAERERALSALEAGNVVLFPQLHFPLHEGEAFLLSPAAAGRAKNVSFDPASGTLRELDRLATAALREAARKKRKLVERDVLARVIDVETKEAA